MSVRNAFTRNAALSAAALLTSVGTLLCCVLPAVLVALGAGAALAGLVKGVVFGVAGLLLVISGICLWYGRSLPCPVDPAAALACQRLRRISGVLYAVALGCFGLGVSFAFVLPKLNG